jgi:predicted RecB family nuclease
VFVYTSYEQRVIGGLAERFPDLAARLEATTSRLVDLHPLTKKHFYHPDMLGSWSLKKVLPVIAPDLRYAAGEVQDGNAASAAWLEAQQPSVTPARRAALAAELTRYCALDTEGLIRLTGHLSSG